MATRELDEQTCAALTELLVLYGHGGFTSIQALLVTGHHSHLSVIWLHEQGYIQSYEEGYIHKQHLKLYLTDKALRFIGRDEVGSSSVVAKAVNFVCNLIKLRSHHGNT